MYAYHSYSIEVAGEPAGIVVQEVRGYRFFASTHRYNTLEGRVFRTPIQAERAARQLVERTAGTMRA